DMNAIRRMFAVLLLLPFTAQLVAAQVSCTPDTVVNLVAVKFESGKQRVPQSFTLTSTENPSLRITVSDRGDGVWWTCEPCRAMVGREQNMKPDFDIRGYSIKPVRGINRTLERGGGCYA